MEIGQGYVEGQVVVLLKNSVSREEFESFLSSEKLKVLKKRENDGFRIYDYVVEVPLGREEEWVKKLTDSPFVLSASRPCWRTTV